MTTAVEEIVHVADAHGFRLRKAVPRRRGHLLLEMARADGTTVAGQWFAETSTAHQVAEQTRACAAAPADVEHLPGTAVVVQHDGTDRLLPTLHELATAPGATLVGHQPERRGVVRRVDDRGRATYTKAVRPPRLPRVLGACGVQVDGVAVPSVVTADATGGTATFAGISGRSLHDLLSDPAVTPARVRALGHAAGAAMARLHAVEPPPNAAHHDAEAEAAVTRRWLHEALAYGVLGRHASSLGLLLDDVHRGLAHDPGPATYVHRDLHDGQLLLTAAGDVGMLDFDLAAVGEPALDLANLLAHLELAGLQNRCTTGRARAWADAVVDGYEPGPDVVRRLPAYERSARLRLACVHAFRPGGEQALALLDTLSGRGGHLSEEREA